MPFGPPISLARWRAVRRTPPENDESSEPESDRSPSEGGGESEKSSSAGARARHGQLAGLRGHDMECNAPALRLLLPLPFLLLLPLAFFADGGLRLAAALAPPSLNLILTPVVAGA